MHMRNIGRLALAWLLAALAFAGSSASNVSAATAAGNQYTCTDAGHNAWIANEPGGLVIGNCLYGTLVYRSFISNPVTNNEGTYQYNGGYITGDFQGCGWIRGDKTAFQGVRGRTNCTGSASIGRASFAHYASCPAGKDGISTCQDGSPLNVRADCPMYANVRPWLRNSPATGYSGPVGRTAVLWRYVTADDRYVMIHLPGTSIWRFISGNCLLNGSEELYRLNPYPIEFYR